MKEPRNKRPFIRLSDRTKLIVFAAIAVMVPTTILTVIQYRSLVDLEDKTKVAVEDNLRETLMQISRKLDWRFKKLASENLDAVSALRLDTDTENATERPAFQKRPIGAEEVFIISSCASSKKATAIISANNCVRRYDEQEAKEDWDVMRLTRYFKNAQLIQDPAVEPKDTLFYQDLVSGNSEGQDNKNQLYSFMPIYNPHEDYSCGFIGIGYSRAYIKTGFLPSAIEQTIKTQDVAFNSTDLYLQVLDENHHAIYSTEPERREYEVAIPFGPIFPRWKLAIGYKNATIDSLARSNFQKSLTLTLMLLAFLVIGITLTLRATAREMRLAQSKSTFVSNVSHELKTPLALIRLFAETLELGRLKNPEKAHEYYRIINNESRRLTQLINNILDFSKIEAGRKEYDFVPTNIAEVVEEVIKSYEYQVTSAGFELTVEIQPNLPMITIDRDAISQAVLNLLNNAVKYSADTKKIDVSVRALNHQLAITVADKGIGIPRSEQKKIFEKFYRVSEGLVHDTKGSGLGLALVKHIVEAHGGQILVESTPGKGSQFTILIPVAEIETTKDLEAETGIGSGGYNVAENIDS